MPAEPGEMLYVGDRLDDDIRPAVKAGLLVALIRRGRPDLWRSRRSQAR